MLCCSSGEIISCLTPALFLLGFPFTAKRQISALLLVHQPSPIKNPFPDLFCFTQTKATVLKENPHALISFIASGNFGKVHHKNNAQSSAVRSATGNSEANSTTPIAEAKAYLQEKQIDFVEKTGNTSGEIVEAAASMVGRVDAVFTPTDNVVMAAEVTVAETLNEAGIPHYTGADSFVAAGAFATCGVNYTELGTYTADMAMDILLGGAVPEFHVMDGGIITVNTETAAILGIDYSVFSSMANTVVEVKTGE